MGSSIMSESNAQTELLHKASILANLDPQIRDGLTVLEIAATVDSTNSALQRLPLDRQHMSIFLAEHQSSGRGRRGRQWYSPPGGNLYLSMGWRFERNLAALGSLPLVVALATARALSRAGLRGHRVKWPNDLLLDGRKFCGCLVEMQGDPRGPCHAVVGVGINVRMPESGETAGIDQPWTDLHSKLPGCSRNELAAFLLEELILQLELFAGRGFGPFEDVWASWDGLHGQVIRVISGNSIVEGTANGVDENGALILDTGEGTQKLHSGEVSLSKTQL
jgi:BirA family biotin operon repressor/biotin-[acetyl-CoA-carboxylase] ligase